MIKNKKYIKGILSFIFMLTSLSGFSQKEKPDTAKTVTIYGGLHIPTVYVKGVKRRGIYRNPGKLERMIRKLYPIALEGDITLKTIEKEMVKYETEKERKAYIKKMEKVILAKYKPV